MHTLLKTATDAQTAIGTALAILESAPVTDAPVTDAPVTLADVSESAGARAEQRKAASAFFAYVDPNSVSVPIKPLAAFKAYRAELGALRCKQPSVRQAAALAVAIIAAGKSTDSKRAVTFPRRFTLATGNYAIENGCAADCVAVGLATYDAVTERFTVNAPQSRAIVSLLSVSAIERARAASLAK